MMAGTHQRISRERSANPRRPFHDAVPIGLCQKPVALSQSGRRKSLTRQKPDACGFRRTRDVQFARFPLAQ